MQIARTHLMSDFYLLYGVHCTKECKKEVSDTYILLLNHLVQTCKSRFSFGSTSWVIREKHRFYSYRNLGNISR